MKTCKLIQVPLYQDTDRLSMDATSLVLKGFPLAEESIGRLLNEGYEVKNMMFHGEALYVYLEKVDKI
ncbi:MAG: hypothetical protein IKQ91_11340 [Oscillospiraceae bacterium]|nr:hypothetical protein [Oscillospiraceae bacterium]